LRRNDEKCVGGSVRGSLNRRFFEGNEPFLRVLQQISSAARSRVARGYSDGLRIHLLLPALMGWMPFILCGCSGNSLVGTSAQAGSLSASPGLVTFGSVPAGQTASSNISVKNSGSAAVQITQVSVKGQTFSVSGVGDLPVTLSAGGTFQFSVSFSPSGTGAETGQLTIASSVASNGTMVVGLSGVGAAAVPASLTALSCANATMSAAGTDNCTVTLNEAAGNSGFVVTLASNNSAATVPATVTVPSGASSAGFSATASSVTSAQTVTLTASAANTTETFALQLNPSSQGSSTGPALSANASTLAFGNVDVNTVATQAVTLSSSGAVSISAATVTGSGFSLSGGTFPVSLNSGQTTTLNVQFDPTVTGAATGTLTIVSNSSVNPATTINLSGTGVSSSYEVNLSWDAPSSSPDPVAGYNVLRSPSGASSYQQLNSSVLSGTTYTDSTVQAGQSYDYIVESVDASGVESAPSNIANAVVP
jgi:hypothetical protein